VDKGPSISRKSRKGSRHNGLFCTREDAERDYFLGFRSKQGNGLTQSNSNSDSLSRLNMYLTEIRLATCSEQHCRQAGSNLVGDHKLRSHLYLARTPYQSPKGIPAGAFLKKSSPTKFDSSS